MKDGSYMCTTVLSYSVPAQRKVHFTQWASTDVTTAEDFPMSNSTTHLATSSWAYFGLIGSFVNAGALITMAFGSLGASLTSSLEYIVISVSFFASIGPSTILARIRFMSTAFRSEATPLLQNYWHQLRALVCHCPHTLHHRMAGFFAVVQEYPYPIHTLIEQSAPLPSPYCSSSC